MVHDNTFVWEPVLIPGLGGTGSGVWNYEAEERRMVKITVQSNLFKRDVKTTAKQSHLEQNPS
jgi:hypothetical protein